MLLSNLAFENRLVFISDFSDSQTNEKEIG